MAQPRPLVDLGPDFERRWRQTPLPRRRELIAELRDLYVMLEPRDEALLARLRNGSIPALRDAAPAPADDQLPLLMPEAPAHQRSLFDDAALPRPSKENPFLPRSILDRLQQSRNRANADLRDLLRTTADDLRPPASPGSLTAPSAMDSATALSAGALPAADEPPPLGAAAQARLDNMERELRLKLGPVVESLIEAQMEQIKSELRVRLRFEMEQLIAEHLRK